MVLSVNSDYLFKQRLQVNIFFMKCVFFEVRTELLNII
jgi:hypothetical protein